MKPPQTKEKQGGEPSQQSPATQQSSIKKRRRFIDKLLDLEDEDTLPLSSKFKKLKSDEADVAADKPQRKKIHAVNITDLTIDQVVNTDMVPEPLMEPSTSIIDPNTKKRIKVLPKIHLDKIPTKDPHPKAQSQKSDTTLSKSDNIQVNSDLAKSKSDAMRLRSLL